MIVKMSQLEHASGLPHPRQATLGSAGYDLHAANKIECEIAPFARHLIPTGVRLELPPGVEAQVRPRSGLAIKHGITVLNTPGTIDSDYRGEIMVLLINLGDAPFTVKWGERIAQLIFAKHLSPHFILSDALDHTLRGTGGFGSTGV